MSKLLPSNFEHNVFINCPFDDKYLPLLHPLLFTIAYLDFIPRISSERSDSGEQRIEKICELIKESKFSVHDLSRSQSVKKKEYFRLNMPFELGIDYGVRKCAESYDGKKFLVLSKDRFDYMKAISDLSGVDIKSHSEEPIKIVRIVRNWLKQYTPGAIPAPQIIWEQFNYFMEDFHDKRKAESFSEEDIYEITSSELGQFIEYIQEWIQQKRNPLGPGLGSTASIIDGSYNYTSSTLPDMAVRELNLTVKSGQISRDESGNLVGEMVMRSPILSVQRIIEKNGGDREVFRSDATELSTEAANPTVFTACSDLTYPRGANVGGQILDIDITYRISTILKGHLEDSHFKGTFDADFYVMSVGVSFQGSGVFDVHLS